MPIHFAGRHHRPRFTFRPPASSPASSPAAAGAQRRPSGRGDQGRRPLQEVADSLLKSSPPACRSSSYGSAAPLRTSRSRASKRALERSELIVCMLLKKGSSAVLQLSVPPPCSSACSHLVVEHLERLQRHRYPEDLGYRRGRRRCFRCRLFTRFRSALPFILARRSTTSPTRWKRSTLRWIQSLSELHDHLTKQSHR